MADTTTDTGSTTTTTASPAPAPTSSTTTTASPAPAPTSSTTTTASPAPAPTTTTASPAPVAPTPDTETDQAELDRIAAAVQGLSEYDRQEIYGQAVEDRYGAFSPRKQAQDIREAYVASSLGDPTRDPVAKQAAMDLTVVQPGAVADAQAVADAGTSSNQAQAAASHTA